MLEFCQKDSIQIACCRLRRGELARLRWTGIDLDAGRLYVRNHEQGATKDDDERTVPITGQPVTCSAVAT